jgi:membrane protein implicated in regulation of membrane protease activity
MEVATMDWTGSTGWWIVTAVLVAAELVTGTFFLLMLAVGTASSALAAHAGLGMNAQLIVGAVVGVAAIAVWHRRRPRQRRRSVASNPDVNIDIGGRVRVDAWTSEGTARVKYRGAAWSARYAGGGVPAPGEHVISAMNGSELMLDRLPPST